MKVNQVMVADVATLEVQDELSLANDIMKLGRIRHLPVVDGKRLVGIISERDLFRRSLAHALGHQEAQARDLMKKVRIREIMTDKVRTVPPEADLKDAVRLMVEHKIGCVPVVKDGELVGLVTETDILMLYLKS